VRLQVADGRGQRPTTSLNSQISPVIVVLEQVVSGLFTRLALAHLQTVLVWSSPCGFDTLRLPSILGPALRTVGRESEARQLCKSCGEVVVVVV
jgi:hypothetical protein